MKRILVLFGTRPEVIKLAPVVRALRRRPECAVRVCSTGQHREMVDQALKAFGLAVDIQLDAMSAAQSLGRLTAQLFRDVDELLEREAPDWVLVQGDTTSAMVGAVGAFYRRIKVGHVEAGLRTYDRWAPFPEEINRTFIAHVAELNFAPTEKAAANLSGAGVASARIHVTGNTVVDAIQWMRGRLESGAPSGIDQEIVKFIEGKRMVLVTSHRRESFGEGLEGICLALLGVVDRYPDAVIVYPVHRNPSVRGIVYSKLGNNPKIKLVDPVDYVAMVWLMLHSYCIFTDSGGIQEEAPSLGKPMLVLRDVTERVEIVEVGSALLVGTSEERILAGAKEIFESPSTYEEMSQVQNPYGDGHASERIASLLERQW